MQQVGHHEAGAFLGDEQPGRERVERVEAHAAGLLAAWRGIGEVAEAPSLGQAREQRQVAGVDPPLGDLQRVDALFVEVDRDTAQQASDGCGDDEAAAEQVAAQTSSEVRKSSSIAANSSASAPSAVTNAHRGQRCTSQTAGSSAHSERANVTLPPAKSGISHASAQ